MSITYTWNIGQLICYTESQGQNDVVCTVFYTLNGTDGTYNGSIGGSVSLTYDQGAAFTPYSELTQDQVLGWVTTSLGQDQIAAMEADIAVQIENQTNPPVVSPPLPWSA